jgi:hypothetical protein
LMNCHRWILVDERTVEGEVYLQLTNDDI